jgi:hypothetical protein
VNPFRRILDIWVATPKWWKGFYVTFPLAFVFGATVMSEGDTTFALRLAFGYAAMVAIALWASERLKARIRGGSQAGPGPTPHGIDPNDLRRRR